MTTSQEHDLDYDDDTCTLYDLYSIHLYDDDCNQLRTTRRPLRYVYVLLIMAFTDQRSVNDEASM